MMVMMVMLMIMTLVKIMLMVKILVVMLATMVLMVVTMVMVVMMVEMVMVMMMMMATSHIVLKKFSEFVRIVSCMFTCSTHCLTSILFFMCTLNKYMRLCNRMHSDFEICAVFPSYRCTYKTCK